MSQTVVQTSAETVVSSGTSGTATLNGVTAGNLLVIVATQETDITAFNTPSDGTNTWAKDVEKATAAQGVAMIASAQNVAGGNTTVTVSPSSGSKTFRFRLLEISGSVTSGVDVTSSITEPSNVTSHVCSADASHINPTGPCIVFCSSAANATLGGTTQGSGYTALSTSGNFTNWQYQIFSSAPTNEQGAWTSVNSHTTNGAIAAYKAAASAGGLFRPAMLNGLGGGGRFFGNPLG